MSGYELYQDEQRVVIATQGSENVKTGDMDQIWILAKDASPVNAVKTGLDAVICGKCPMRAPLGHGFSGRTCYVKVMQGPSSVWHAWKRGNYPRLPLIWYADVFTNRAVRFGAYGDPVHIPLRIVRWVAFYAKSTTGYTHQWQEPQYQAYRDFLMASVESADGSDMAHRLGWRTFRVRRAEDPLVMGEITCPASDEAGRKTQCVRCGLCGGSRKVAKNVAIIAHGLGAKNLIQIGVAV